MNLTKKVSSKVCPICYGKGYSTVFKGDSFCLADFIGDKAYKIKNGGISIKFCNCERGRDLSLMFNVKKQFK